MSNRDPASAGALPGAPAIEPPAGQGVEQNKGPHSAKGLVVTRVAAVSGELSTKGGTGKGGQLAGPTRPGRNGGTLRSGSFGKRSQLSILQEMARKGLRRAIAVANRILNDEPMRDEDLEAIAAVDGRVPGVEKVVYSVEDKMRAAEFLRRTTGMDKSPPMREKRTHFGVLRRSEGEVAEVIGDDAG